MHLPFTRTAKPVVVAGATLLGTGAATAATRAGSCSADAARPAADAYLDALTSHDASAVPFAPNVLRVEDGLVTGRSADELPGAVTDGRMGELTDVVALPTGGFLAAGTDWSADPQSGDAALLTSTDGRRLPPRAWTDRVRPRCAGCWSGPAARSSRSAPG